MTELACLSVTVHGRVQGVYYRDFTERQARDLELTGYAKNLPGGRSVEVLVEGAKNKLDELIKRLQVGPYGARVERLDIRWEEYGNKFDNFQIKYWMT